jgi:DNA-binding transcriptional MerR regulator
MESLTIGKLARRAGVGIDTVRFYERAGLIPRARRTPSGYRLYAQSDADRLRFIRRAKGLGFSLEEIAELLQLNAGKGNRATVKRLAQQRLDDLDRRIREMSAIRDALGQLVRQCSGSGPVAGCPIIDGVLGETAEHCKEH